jgi:hypothetical protein
MPKRRDDPGQVLDLRRKQEEFPGAVARIMSGGPFRQDLELMDRDGLLSFGRAAGVPGLQRTLSKTEMVDTIDEWVTPHRAFCLSSLEPAHLQSPDAQ